MVHLYSLCWDEVEMLGFFFRHYDGWVDRYVIYDDGSTDGSLDVLRQHPRVEVREFPRVHPDSFVLSHRELQNEVWKESRGQADWVVITALDEHLHIKERPIADYLRDCRRQGVTLVPALGFQMISDDSPTPGEWLCETRTWGAPWSVMSKLSIFNPSALVETGFSVGRHQASPSGSLCLPDRDELMLLHYKYVNFEKTLRRHQEQGERLGQVDVAQSWGVQYRWSGERLRQEWTDFQARAVDIGEPGFAPSTTHEAPHWRRALTSQQPTD